MSVKTMKLPNSPLLEWDHPIKFCHLCRFLRKTAVTFRRKQEVTRLFAGQPTTISEHDSTDSVQNVDTNTGGGLVEGKDWYIT